MELPVKFKEQMKELLQEEYADYLQSFDHDRYYGLRVNTCLLYTSPSPRDAHESRMPSSA